MSTMQTSAVITIALTLAAPAVEAQEWTHELAPYFWGAAMDGVSAVGPVEGEIDLSFSDILDNLEFGAMGAYRARKDRLSLMFDVVYMGLGASTEGPRQRVNVDMDVDQTALEFDMGYHLSERFLLLAGVRYNDLQTEIEVTGPLIGVRSGKGSESWWDPVIGAQLNLPLTERWSFALRGDVGGFGVGSDLAWQGIATLRWQTSPNFGLLFAYRYFDMDYADGSPRERGYFKYDMAISGPGLGVVFSF